MRVALGGWHALCHNVALHYDQSMLNSGVCYMRLNAYIACPRPAQRAPGSLGPGDLRHPWLRVVTGARCVQAHQHGLLLLSRLYSFRAIGEG